MFTQDALGVLIKRTPFSGAVFTCVLLILLYLFLPMGWSAESNQRVIDPAVGGQIAIPDEVTLDIPSEALSGSTSLEVVVQTLDETPPHQGFKQLGKAYQLTIDGDDLHIFIYPATISFNYRYVDLPTGQTPAVYRYDELQSSWVSLGGTVSSSTVTAEIDQCAIYAIFALTGMIDQPTGSGPAPEESLNDIAGHWADNNIKEMVSWGVVSGYPDGGFKPDKPITRAELTSFLVKSLIKRSGYSLEPNTGFTDTKTHWAGLYISSAVSYGVVTGYDENLFGPDDMITREQMAAMLVRAVNGELINTLTTFSDQDQISSWAVSYVATAVNSGVISGYPNNTFAPQKNATRAEAVTAILNALG